MHTFDWRQGRFAQAAPMLLALRKIVRSHSSRFALILGMVIATAATLETIHDYVADHEHTIECSTCVVDGKQPLPNHTYSLVDHTPLVESTVFIPTFFVQTHLQLRHSRAPPKPLV